MIFFLTCYQISSPSISIFPLTSNYNKTKLNKEGLHSFFKAFMEIKSERENTFQRATSERPLFLVTAEDGHLNSSEHQKCCHKNKELKNRADFERLQQCSQHWDRFPREKPSASVGPCAAHCWLRSFRRGFEGGARRRPEWRAQGWGRRPWPLLPHAHQLQVGILADLGGTQWVSSVNCWASGRPNVGLGGKLVLVLSRGYTGRSEEAGPNTDGDLVHQSAGVGGIGCSMPGGALGGEEMSNGAGWAQCGSRGGGSIRIQVRLAWQVSRGGGQVWVPRRV